MQNSLPARPSLEQLRKLAKDLVRQHADKQPDALALIGRHLPALADKSALELAAYPFALHDAQSVLARQYGFAGWNDLSAHVAGLEKADLAPVADLDVSAKLNIVLRARKENDYALWSSVMSEQFNARVPQEKFEEGSQRLADLFRADYRVTYLGLLNNVGGPVYLWRLWVPGWDSDLFIRMGLNPAGKISGLLFSSPWDTAIGRK